MLHDGQRHAEEIGLLECHLPMYFENTGPLIGDERIESM